MEFFAAVALWSERKIEIAKEPELYEWKDDVEREMGLRIIRGIWERFAENPNVAYRGRKDELDSLETLVLEKVKPILGVWGG